MTARATYERFRPLIIWLGLTELAWIAYWLLSIENATQPYVGTVLFWAISMLLWMGAVVLLGTRGFFLQRTRYLSNLVGFTGVLVFASLLFGVVPVAREGLTIAVKNVPDVQLISIHILRLLAIGGIIKYLHGELPRHFMVLGALPDFFFGMSAVVVTVLVLNGALGHNFLVAWHVLGFSVFTGAGFSMFFSVPSLFRIYHSKPDTSIVFQFPMLLAPNFTVPLFALAHAIALVKLFTV